MRVVIAGCGRVGSSLAQMLVDDGHDVTVVDTDPDALARLGKSFNGTIVEGNAYDVDVLTRAGIELADVFTAVTDNDNVNLMAVEVAKAVFGTPRVIARLYDPAREESYRALDVPHVTGTKLIAKVIFEQVIEEEFAYHVAFTAGDVQMVEFTLGEAAGGKTVADLEVPDRLRVAAIRRGDRTIVPDETTELEPGDLVVAAARTGVGARIRELLALPTVVEGER